MRRRNGSRAGGRDRVAQLVGACLEVAAGGRYRFMTEQLLDLDDRSAIVEQIHCKGVAQRMNESARGYLGPHAGLPVDTVEQVLHLTGRDPLARVGVDEEGSGSLIEAVSREPFFAFGLVRADLVDEDRGLWPDAALFCRPSAASYVALSVAAQRQLHS